MEKTTVFYITDGIANLIYISVARLTEQFPKWKKSKYNIEGIFYLSEYLCMRTLRRLIQHGN